MILHKITDLVKKMPLNYDHIGNTGHLYQPGQYFSTSPFSIGKYHCTDKAKDTGRRKDVKGWKREIKWTPVNPAYHNTSSLIRKRTHTHTNAESDFHVFCELHNGYCYPNSIHNLKLNLTPPPKNIFVLIEDLKNVPTRTPTKKYFTKESIA